MGILKEIFDTGAKHGSYLRGMRHAIEGRPRMTWKFNNRDEYNQGYNDGMEERKIRALERRNKKK